jgi:hypothetical protein
VGVKHRRSDCGDDAEQFQPGSEIEFAEGGDGMNGKILGFTPSRQFGIYGHDQGNTEAQPTHFPEFGQGANLLPTPGSAPVGMDHKRALFSLDTQNSTSSRGRTIKKRVTSSTFHSLPLSTDAPRGSRRLAQQDVDIEKITVELKKILMVKAFFGQQPDIISSF